VVHDEISQNPELAGLESVSEGEGLNRVLLIQQA
jgi:predicted RNA-binding protein Jag